MATPRRCAAVLVCVSALVLPPGAAEAEQGSPIEIATVNGHPAGSGRITEPLSGEVTVSGSGGGREAQQPTPLVADAGDSSFVAAGEKAVLLGSAYGGTAPYTFTWTSASGKLTAPESSSTELDTTGLQPGTYDVRLAVTDAAGNSTSDTVKFVVKAVDKEELLDRDVPTQPPGVIALGWVATLEFTVPEHTDRLDAHLTYGDANNDYELALLDPDGSKAGGSRTGAGSAKEQATVDDPKAGTWTAQVTKWTPFADTAHLRITGLVGQPDPRPKVSAGGPYAFATGTEQTLSGSVTAATGGASDVGPFDAAWDLDGDGIFEPEGTEVTVALPQGRHLVTFKATNAAGMERRETTSVLVADPAVIDTMATPLTVIGVADTGINPYHLEFSAQTYPDPDVLALTGNFTKHPSEYIPGYPADAEALDVTLGQGYFPAADNDVWSGDTIKQGKVYWIPGTKVIGAVDAGDAGGATSGPDTYPILDDDGHGTGSASVSAGNRYGYCPTCLIVVVESLDATVAAGLDWVDISTNSFGYIGGLPFGKITGNPQSTKRAAERGQTTLFAAGNGMGNAWDVPIVTWHSDNTGPDWNVTVGAIRRDNQRAIIGDGMPVHLSSWGDGNLPSACGKGTVGQCVFSGTSAATPYTAGVFGTVLSHARAAVGDEAAGQKPGQVVAEGVPVEGSDYLSDGKLTRGELREVVLKTAEPLGQANTGLPFVYPATVPHTGEANVLFEGYGAATPNSAQRAVDVLLGRAQLPDRPFEDEFFANDRTIRDTLWGGFDRTGDGQVESAALSAEQSEWLGLRLSQVGSIDTVADALGVLGKVALAKAPTAASMLAPMGENTIDYYLHRRVADASDAQGCSTTTSPAADSAGNEQYMDRDDSGGDLEPCIENRVTSVIAPFRPFGMFASTDTLDAPLAAGSTVNVELFIAGETPTVVRPTGVLVATDREVGLGEGTPLPVVGSGPDGSGCAALGEACWTKYEFSFDTTRPVFTGEQLSFQVRLAGTRSWAFGHEGQHASKISIDPAPLPDTGLEFGATIDSPADGAAVWESDTVTAGGGYAFPDLGEDPSGAGDHPVSERVEVSVYDPEFADPVEAVLDPESQTWRVELAAFGPGEHTIYTRARRSTTTSDAASSTFTVRPDRQVQWQVTPGDGSADEGVWTDISGGPSWSFRFTTADYGAGLHAVLVRLTERGNEVARDSVIVEFE